MEYELSIRDMEELRQQLDIDLLGVTTSEPFCGLTERLTEHREKGYESGFEHPIIEERVDPSRLVPDAKSIVAIGMAYYTDHHHTLRRPKGTRGVLSKYAWGNDYHPILRKKLEELAHAIERKLGRAIAWHASVDTGPLVDRAVAERAGIGWFGKNCNIITEQFGSWVFLGQLVTDVKIEPYRPFEGSRCGDCDLCMRACPTGAIIAPFTIDSSKCLAYITQMKGMIPREFRSKMGTRIWGCDTCQVVCPSNKGITFSGHADFVPEPELSFPELNELLHMSNKQFKRRYGHTAAAWRGLTVIKRNAIIALGNMREKRAVPQLLPFLKDERPELRGTTVWALGKIGTDEAVKAIREARMNEKDPLVLQEMEDVLGKNGHPGNEPIKADDEKE
jgi:epoxyqueuosine reductase